MRWASFCILVVFDGIQEATVPAIDEDAGQKAESAEVFGLLWSNSVEDSPTILVAATEEVSMMSSAYI